MCLAISIYFDQIKLEKMKKLIAVVITVTGLGMAGCYNDNHEELYPKPSGPGCDTLNVTYNGRLKGIVDNQCATSGCHASFAPTGYDLSSYAGLKAAAVNGKLMSALNHTGPFPMPKDMPKLDPCTLAQFQAWINKGTPE